MTKKVSKSTRRGSKRVKTDRSIVVVCDLRQVVSIDQDITISLYQLWPLVCQDVILDILEELRGYDRRVQQFIIKALKDYVAGKCQHRTFIKHVDEMLVNLYKEIDEFLLEQESQQ